MEFKMIMTGMIYRYFDEELKGTLMLSDGEIKEFTKTQWIDTEIEPGIGQKIIYTEDQNGITIRTGSDEEIEEIKNTVQPQKEEQAVEKETKPNHQFNTADEAISHFENLGYKCIKDITNEDTRSISLRFYDQGEFGEVFITVQGTSIELKQTKNGKPV
jgi:hypothetical protein